ncbi:MAG: hypothetical protein ACOX1S_10280 [Anaerostipes sp.]|jgi:hypothetical protein
MQIPISVRIENAKGKILDVVNEAGNRFELPASVMDGVLSSVLAEVRSSAKVELINGFNYIAEQEEAERKKAADAKKEAEKQEEGEQ